MYGYIGQLSLSINTFLITTFFCDLLTKKKKIPLTWGEKKEKKKKSKSLQFELDLYSSYSKPFHHKGLVDTDGKRLHAPINENPL